MGIRDVEAETVEAVLFLWKRKRKFLPIPHRVFDLKSNLAKNFVQFPMWTNHLRFG